MLVLAMVAGTMKSIGVGTMKANPIELKEDEKRQTLYLPLGVYEQLRKAAFDRGISMQGIVRKGIDLWFAANGLPSWDNAKKKGEKR
jgi:hypothetical protein